MMMHSQRSLTSLSNKNPSLQRSQSPNHINSCQVQGFDGFDEHALWEMFHKPISMKKQYSEGIVDSSPFKN